MLKNNIKMDLKVIGREDLAGFCEHDNKSGKFPNHLIDYPFSRRNFLC
jgi:hypothetical protein